MTKLETLYASIKRPSRPWFAIRQAIDTFIDALRKIGLDRIPAVGIQHGGGYNLVSKDKHPTMPGRIWPHECDGWYKDATGDW